MSALVSTYVPVSVAAAAPLTERHNPLLQALHYLYNVKGVPTEKYIVADGDAQREAARIACAIQVLECLLPVSVHSECTWTRNEPD